MRGIVGGRPGVDNEAMRVLSTPPRLGGAAWGLLALPALGLLQWTVVHRQRAGAGLVGVVSRWAAQDPQAFGLAAGAGVLGLAVLILGVRRARPWAFPLLAAGSSVWVLATLAWAVRERTPAAGFFSLGLGLVLGAIVTWIRIELGNPGLRPGWRWYEGRPPTLPGLESRLWLGEGNSVPFRLTRLAEDAGFGFLEGTTLKEALAAKTPRLELKFGGNRAELPIRWVSRADRAAGLGFAIPEPSLAEIPGFRRFRRLLAEFFATFERPEYP